MVKHRSEKLLSVAGLCLLIAALVLGVFSITPTPAQAAGESRIHFYAGTDVWHHGPLTDTFQRQINTLRVQGVNQYNTSATWLQSFSWRPDKMVDGWWWNRNRNISLTFYLNYTYDGYWPLKYLWYADNRTCTITPNMWPSGSVYTLGVKYIGGGQCQIWKEQ